LRANAEEKHKTETKRTTTTNDLAMVINGFFLWVIDVVALGMRELRC